MSNVIPFVQTPLPTRKSEPVKERRILLQGAPGTGKTTFCCGFPNLVVVDMDHKLPGGFNTFPFWDLDWCKTVEPNSRERRDKVINLLRNNISKFTPEQTLLLDSWNSFQMYVNDAIQKDSGDDGRKFYRLKLQYSEMITDILKSARCTIITTVHESTKGENITQLRPLMEGKFGDTMPGHYTDHYRSFITTERGADGKVVNKYSIAIQPDNLCDCFVNPELGPRIKKAGIRTIPNTYNDYINLYNLPA